MSITPLPTPPSRDDAANFSARADAFLAALPTFVTETNATAAGIDADVAVAEAAAASAVASPNTQGASTDSLAITIGSKTLTIQTGKSIVTSMWVAITLTADGNKFMAGSVTSYNIGTGQLIVDVERVSGTGTYSAWTVVGVTPSLPDSAARALAAGSTIADPTGTPQPIGYRGAPVISVTTSRALALSDVGCTLELGVGAAITVPLRSSVAFAPGDIILFQEVAGATKTITPAAGVTQRLTATASTGTRTLKAYGQGMIRFGATANLAFISGDLT